MHRRAAIGKVLIALRDTRVVLLHGARQTGKTILAKQVCEAEGASRRYLTLDDAAVRGNAAADPQGFIDGLPARVVIDEVQRVPELFLAIKMAVDRDPTPGRFLLTGSANAMLLPRVGDSLAGRIEVRELWPLSQGEIEGREDGFVDAVFAEGPLAKREMRTETSKVSLLERIVRGGFPEPVDRSDGERREEWFRSYISRVLERDVRELANVEGLKEFPRLLSLMASRVGGLMNFADLSRSLSMPQSTLKRYVSLLQATFIVTTSPAWASNLGVRLTKSPKVYLCDTGLASSLLGLSADGLTHNSNAAGGLLENFVALELLKQLGWSRTRASLYHFRTLSGKEVDLVLEDRAGNIVGIEVKWTGSIGPGDFKGLHELREIAGERFKRGVVLYSGEQTLGFGKQFEAAPIEALWRMA